MVFYEIPQHCTSLANLIAGGNISHPDGLPTQKPDCNPDFDVSNTTCAEPCECRSADIDTCHSCCKSNGTCRIDSTKPAKTSGDCLTTDYAGTCNSNGTCVRRESKPKTEEKSLNMPLIIGLSVGGFVVILVTGICIYCIRKKPKTSDKKKRAFESEESDASESEESSEESSEEGSESEESEA